MRPPVLVEDAVDLVRRLGPVALTFRAAVVGGVVILLVVGDLVSVEPKGMVTLTLVLLGFAVAAAVRPDSAAPLLLIVVMVVCWPLLVGSRAVDWSVVPALCVLAVHVAAARAAALAEHAHVEAPVHRRWATQTGLVAAAGVVVWGLVVALEHADLPGALAVTAVALLLLTAFGILVGRATRSE